MNNVTKEQVLTKSVKHLFNTIDSEDLFEEKDGQWTTNGKIMNDGEKKLLQSEAKLFMNTRLWKVLKNEVKFRAEKAMFEKAKTEMDLTAGKLFLYVLDVIQTRLDKLLK